MSFLLSALLILTVGLAQEQTAGLRKTVDPREVIALEAGTWDAVITTPSRNPGGGPTTATGVQINELRSGGLWILNRLSVNGGAYEGTGIWGYDPKTGHYSGAWVDNGTGRIRMDDGAWDPKSSTMTWTSQLERADGRVIRMRATSTFAGNRRTYRSFAMTDSGEVPLSTVIFTRRHSPARN
jgi:hypothetical protein